MTDEERELLMLNVTMTVALLRDQYGQNMSTAYDDPGMKDRLYGINKTLLGKMARMMALQTRVKEPDVQGLDMDLLLPLFEKEILSSIRMEMEEQAKFWKDRDSKPVLDELIKRFELEEDDVEGS